MVVVTEVAGRLATQARIPEAAEKNVVKQFDASKSVLATNQEPPQRADSDANGGDGQIRLLDAVLDWS